VALELWILLLVFTRSAHNTRHGLRASHVLGLNLTKSTKCATEFEMKAKFSYCDQIMFKFKEHVLKPETPE